MIAAATVAGDAPGWLSRYNAATPATCALAMEVPDITLLSVSLPIPADGMLLPGAKRSRQGPKFEAEGAVNWERASLIAVAPTVSAPCTRAGEKLQAFALSFPAAITYVTPSLMERVTALSSACEGAIFKLMFATAGWPA